MAKSKKENNTKKKTILISIFIVLLVLILIYFIINSEYFIGPVPYGPTSCSAKQNFTCNSPTAYSTTFHFIFSQNTGTNWTSANIIYINSSAYAYTSFTNNYTGFFTPQNVTTISDGIVSAQVVPLNITIPIPQNIFPSPGGPICKGCESGILFAQYQTSGNNQFKYAPVAIVFIHENGN
ncbi:MAG: hypothetical protein ABR981_00005 [Candidatus Micrarchaeaceae archaeon]|jgi:hypothetical protein